MDAPAPPVAYESRPGPDRGGGARKPTETKPQRATLVAARGGVGLGLGTSGVAAHALAQAEVFPLPFLGLGVEMEAAGSRIPAVIVPTDSDGLGASRGRISVRIPVTKVALVGAFALGKAQVQTVDEYYLPEEDCDWCFNLIPDIASRHHYSETLSAVVELGVQYQLSFLELGAHLRVNLSPPVLLATVGPTLGIGF